MHFSPEQIKKIKYPMKILNFIFQNKNNEKDNDSALDLKTEQYSKIAKLVKEGRVRKNLSIEELSELSKIPESALNAIENNIKDLRPKYPFIRSILLKLEDCLSLKKNTLLGLSIREKNTKKKDKKNFVIRKYDFINSWQGSVAYFLFLILIIFFLNRYFISNKPIIEVQIIKEKLNKK